MLIAHEKHYKDYYTKPYHQCHHQHHKERREREYVPEEFNKAKPPTFDGEMRKLEDVEAWPLKTKNIFQIHDYSKNMKAKVMDLNIKFKANIWWEDLKNVKGITKEGFSWKEFEEYFQNKYLSDRHYDSNAKDFYELRLRQMTYDEYTTKFLELLRYIPYLKEETKYS